MSAHWCNIKPSCVWTVIVQMILKEEQKFIEIVDYDI